MIATRGADQGSCDPQSTRNPGTLPRLIGSNLRGEPPVQGKITIMGAFANRAPCADARGRHRLAVALPSDRARPDEERHRHETLQPA